MDDLISRQVVIRWVKTECNPYGNPTLDFESGKKVIEHLEQMPPAQPGWIPCSKKLPELNRSVLVQLSDDFVDPIQIMTLDISKCEGDFFYFWRTQEMGINFDMDDVVAWQPLPTPYREGGQEQNHESTI